MGAFFSTLANFFYTVIPQAIAKFFIMLGERLFAPDFWNKFPDGKNRGVFWMYMWWCVKISVYLAIFSIGGIGLTILGIIYIYFKLYRKLTTPKNKDEDEREKMMEEEKKYSYYQQEDV
jgi:hypothetical protein